MVTPQDRESNEVNGEKKIVWCLTAEKKNVCFYKI